MSPFMIVYFVKLKKKNLRSLGILSYSKHIIRAKVEVN